MFFSYRGGFLSKCKFWIAFIGVFCIIFIVLHELMLDRATLSSIKSYRYLFESESKDVFERRFQRDSDSNLYKGAEREQQNYTKINSSLQRIPVVRRYSDRNVSHMTYVCCPYIINKPLVCVNVTLPLYLFVVHSATSNLRKRMDIRNTWGQRLQFKTKLVLLLFVMGRSKNKSLQSAIEKEDELYKDIIQGDFLDVYRNLTHKAVFWLRWVTEYCPNVDHLIKVDDDIFVNTFRVFEVINQTRDTDRKIFCKLRPAFTNRLPRSGKWKLEEEDFKNFTHYPFPFSNGFFVIFSGKLIPELYKAAGFTPFFWLDDVFLTGILAENAGGITHVDLMNNITFFESTACFKNNQKVCNLIATGASNRITQQYMWSYVLKSYRKTALTLMVKDTFDIIFNNT